MACCKAPLAVGLVVLFVTGAIAGGKAGVCLSKQAQHPSTSASSCSANKMPSFKTMDAQHAPEQRFVKDTPYGRWVTTEQKGTKDGVHYQISESKLIPYPQNSKSPYHHVMQPGSDTHQNQNIHTTTKKTQTPYGTMLTTTKSGTENGMHFQITTQRLLDATPQQRQREAQHFRHEQQAFNQDMDHMMQQQMLEQEKMERQMQQMIHQINQRP